MPCRVIVDAAACRYPLHEGSTVYCYWHRLLRTSLDAQIREAGRRLKRASGAPDYVERERVAPKLWPLGERWCAGCQSFVPLFYCRGSRCKACDTAATRASRDEKTYGITPEERTALLALQNGRCAVCRRRQNDRALANEHSHQTGRMRGLACTNCNHKLLGGGFDSARMMLAALVYLLAPPTSGQWLKPEEYGDRLMLLMERAIIDLNAERRSAEGQNRGQDAPGGDSSPDPGPAGHQEHA